ncbi:MAG: rhomboid family intramembrane serine protease [Deltaproteobacteria bacterium]|nr:rhomboid family intramembrane serine protease [Deltaproteobacteria bacterium]
MTAGDLSALVQQFLLFHGARYTSRADEENWKTVPVTLQVPPQPIEALQLAAGPWVVVPWRLAGADHLQVWLERLAASGSRPRVLVLAQDRALLAEHHVLQLATAHRLDIVALCADPPGVTGTAQAALVAHAFDADMQRSMASCNPLVHLAATGDARDPQVFLERLRHAAPQVPVTRSMTGINVLVYAAMVFAAAARPEGGLWSTVAGGFGTGQLVAWGANATGHMAAEPWRLLTSAFLHGNLLHIAMNLLALWQLGAMAERLLGSRAFGAAYLLSALGGAVASFGWHALQGGPSVSVGASGAVFGVLGATVGFALARRDTIPSHVYRALLRSGGMFVLINVGLGLAVPVIDNAAHLGGLVTGTAAGAALSRELPPGPQPQLGTQAAIAVGFLLVLGIVFRVALGLAG